MSMYTQLLGAACEQRPVRAGTSMGDAIDEVRRCHGELADGLLPKAGATDDTVSVILALELRYDVALVELAGVLDVETGPSRFELPHVERERLVEAFRASGISLELPGPRAGVSGSGSARAPAPTALADHT